MISLISSSIGVLFVLIGALAVWIMLEIQGNPKKRENLNTLSRTHKVLGYLFIFIYAIMSVFMVIKVYGYHQEFFPRATIHMVLALFLTPMILLKLGIVKRFKRLFPYLPVLALISIFARIGKFNFCYRLCTQWYYCRVLFFAPIQDSVYARIGRRNANPGQNAANAIPSKMYSKHPKQVKAG
jgi:hypothetical protein